MLREIITFLSSIVMTAAFAATAFGQATGGAVTGTVVDANGGVVTGAAITLRSKATGQALTAQSTEAGVYSFPNVAVGDHAITVEVTGFAPVTQDLRVALNQTTSVDVTLRAAGVTENVEVTAASEALVQSDSSQLGKTYETQLVQNLPTFGNQNTLALLSPNVVVRGSGTQGTGGSVGGTRARSNVFTLDGVDNNDPGVTGPSVGVIQDAVDQFTLLSNNFNAEFGGGGGGQFVTITRSGTNEFHGSAFVYAQNQALNAASTAEELQLQSGEINEKPRFRDTRFGLTFGGPIRKNNLFFFGAYEKEINAAEGGAAAFLSPTAEGFGRISSLPGVSPFAINYLRNYLTLASAATETQSVLGVPGIPFGEVTINVPVGFKQDLAQFNIDHQPSSRDQFRYRFNLNKIVQEQAGGGNVLFSNLINYETKLFSATWVRTFGSSLVNDLRLSYRNQVQDYPLKNPEFLTLPNVQLPAFGLDLGPAGNLPQSGKDNVYQVFDTISYIRGRHNFKFGGEFKRVLSNQDFLSRGRGDYIYDEFDDLLLDVVPPGDNAKRGVGSGSFAGNVSKYFAFAQDDWKVTPNLTLNLGVRYEYVGVPRDVRNQELNRIADVPGVIEFGVPETDKNNWAPRVGFAYSPEAERGIFRTLFGGAGKSAIRGNFAVSYSDVFQNFFSIQLPPQVAQELTPDIAVARFGFNAGQGFLERGGLPSFPAPPTTTAAARALTGGVVNSLTAPYTMAFALGVQRELSPTMAIEIRYLGTRSRKLGVQTQLNAPNVDPALLSIPTFFSVPTAAQLTGRTTLLDILDAGVGIGPLNQYGFIGPVTEYKSIGNAQYDSGSVNVTRRFSRGLAFTASYTFSKTIDDSTNEFNSSAVNPRRPENGFNIRNERGLSANDVPHRFVVAGNYELPFFKSSGNGFLRSVVGGLELAGIFQVQSGQPVTPRSALDSNLNNDNAGDRAIFNENGVPGTGSNIRAYALVGGHVTVVPLGDERTTAYVPINPNAQFIRAGFGARANSGRNVLRSNGFNRTDLTALKNFRFGEERYNLQIGAEVFNLFNQRIRTVGDNSSLVGDPVFGVGPQSAFANVNSALFNDYSGGVYGGRSVQLRAKFIF
ncbi:MAG TPA: TonB-dependent receptor [Pyrinomonadaceae bacterium]|nr:TonB-dependent receptor [Pyrinomonadaceae bacterium]